MTSLLKLNLQSVMACAVKTIKCYEQADKGQNYRGVESPVSIN